MDRKIYGISLGAGFETLTLKGARLLEEADVILLSGSKSYNKPEEVKIILDDINCGHKLIVSEMPASSNKVAHAEHTQKFAKKCMEYIETGKKTVYVTMGDVTVYTSFGELYKIFKSNGIHLEAVSGISAFMSPAAAIGSALVEWNENFCVTPMPATKEELEDYVTKFDSVVIMKIYDGGAVLKDFLSDVKPKTAVMVVNAYKKDESVFDLNQPFPENIDVNMSVVLLRK